MQAEANLDKWTPLGPLGLADEMQAGFLGRVIGLLRIAFDAGADNVFPRGRPAAVAGDHVVEVQILAVENNTAILAGVFVPFEDIVPCKFDFLLGQAVIDQKQNDPRNPDSKRNGLDGFVMRRAFGKIPPFTEIKGAKGAILGVDDSLGMTLKKQSQSAPGGADIHGLPQPVQHEDMLI